MAIAKATVKPTAKVQAKVTETKKVEEKVVAQPQKVEVKAEQMKLDVVAEPKKTEEKPAETTVKKETVKKPAAKKAEKKTTAAKKATAAKKEEVKTSVHVQFNGKSYETEDFVKIAKDIWKYDLKKKAADFKSVEIYVKPEENMAYYVINGEVEGSFLI